MAISADELRERIRQAVRHFWKTRRSQQKKQKAAGRKDQGARSAVTGGAQMDGFVGLFSDIIEDCGIGKSCVFRKSRLELPGFFRPEKQWDLVVVKGGRLVLALEAKSQVGPSFGNNFNNRAEEAIGSAVDLWTAFREGKFNDNVQPWLGYCFMLEDCERSRKPVKVVEPHFEVFPEFRDASYARRYEILCSKLVRERHYNSAAFLMSDAKSGIKGEYAEPADGLRLEPLVRSLIGHVSTFARRD